MKRIDSFRATLLVPSIVVCEIAANPDADKVSLFMGAIQRTNVEQIDITTQVASEAGKLRRMVLDEGMKLKTPDALIIAAANYSRADYILSVDPHILRCNKKFEITSEIGKPSIGHDQPLLEDLPDTPSA